jgi:hypothetical protein
MLFTEFHFMIFYAVQALHKNLRYRLNARQGSHVRKIYFGY